MTTDITELAQREKFEAWLSDKPFHARYMHWSNTLNAYDYTGIQLAWEAYQAGGAELVEALEKAQQHIARQEQIILNQDESLSIRRGELEKAQAQSSKWLEAYHKAVSIGARYEERIAELESRTVTVKLPDDEDGQAYGFGKWANRAIPAAAGTMMISYCEDAWRAAFEVFSNAAGIKWEAE
ncbi:ead/Ea22-like family protein [Raoultella sp. RIT712]|uniref:ead/Ea22-like family protein n=1 Tax=Raoultella sp. RIT712 TaxID=2666191 RepID=UPI001D0D909E|nr:ead/Ea22-like family protein [Raoultella sp. RIT712]